MDSKVDIKLEEKLSFNLDEKFPNSRLVRLDVRDPTFYAVRKMMRTEGNISFSSETFDIVNIFAQQFKRKNYDFDMENQHALFLCTSKNRLADEIANGVQMFKYSLRNRDNWGAMMTDYFNFAASSMLDSKGHAFVPIVSAALGNVHVCNKWQDFDAEFPIPKGCNSTWLRGVHGHTATSMMEFSHFPLKISVDKFQINKHRLHPLENSVYIVDNPNQVEIILVVEVQMREPR